MKPPHLRSIRLPMDRETPPRPGACGGFAWTCAYARSDEARAFSETGQDALVLCCDGRRLVFALCDGVSDSFFGDLAARFLAGALVKWLWTCDVTGPDLPGSLARMLEGLTGPATDKVMSRPLPDSLPPLVRDVLERKRLQGSQTTFVCARLDLPCERLADGAILAAGLGDTRLRVWGPAGETTEGAVRLSAEKWSTRPGVAAGQPWFFSTRSSATVRQIIAYTDGLAALDAERGPSFAGVVGRQMEPPVADDCCFLSVTIAADRQERIVRSRTWTAGGDCTSRPRK